LHCTQTDADVCSLPLAVSRLLTHINRIRSMPRRLQRMVPRPGSLGA
jgi:hypothetical protein